MRKKIPGPGKRPVQQAASGCASSMKALWKSVPRTDARGIPTAEEFIRFLAERAQAEEK